MKTRLYVLRNIEKFTLMVKGSIIGLVFITIFSMPFSLISPKIFQIFVDEVLRGGRTERFAVVIFGLLLMYVLQFVSDGIILILKNRVLNTFTYNVRKAVFEKYQKAPYSFIEKREVGELKMRIMDDVDSLGNFILEQVVNYISGIITILSISYVVVSISKMMTLYCVLIIPCVLVINHLIGVGTKRINEEIRTMNSAYYTSTHNSLQFWKEIKVQNAQKRFIERFKGYRNALAKLGLKSIRYWFYNEVFNDVKLNYLSKVFVYIVGAFFVMKNEITVGILIMFSEYFAMLFSALESVNSKRIELKTNAPYYERIFETFSFPVENTDKDQGFNFKSGITVKNVSFSYVEGQTVLKDVSIQINKGDYIAIVGNSGCGKTTLIKLLMGLCAPNEGQILYDGIDVNQIDKQNLYNILGVVMQDNFIFNMSIRENLLLAKEDATDEEIKEACKKANFYDYIMGLPNGFDTQVGERGVMLSGGQKQRLSIAATLLKNPQIIILDEATSSLDKPSEDIINDAINQLAKDVTVIVVAHKPATALRAKKIVVMEGGQITASGTNKEVFNTSKYYRELVEAIKNE